MLKNYLAFFVVLFSSVLSYGQNELSRLKTESLWYTLKEQYANYNLILSASNSKMSQEAEAKRKGYDGLAVFARYDVVRDQESTLYLLYKIDNSSSRITLYLEEAGAIPFYVKFRGTQACVYELDRDTNEYGLLGMFDYFDVQSHMK